MTIQELGLTRNLRVVEEAWVEALTKKSIEEFLKKHSEDVVVYDPTLPGPLKGQSALRELVDGLYRMFPDYQVKRVRSFGQDEWVCLEAEETATMKGSLHGPGGRTIPPTKKNFKIQSTFVCKVLGGKISEIRVYFDVLGLMAQLDLGP